MLLVQVQEFGTDTRYHLDFLHQCGERVKTKSQKVWGVSCYVCRSYTSYRGKTGRETVYLTSHPLHLKQG